MKRKFSRTLSWVLSVVMVIGVMVIPVSIQASATQSASGGFSSGYTLTGDGFTDMVNIAMAQNEKTQSEIGYSESWCADFVSDCARLAGQEAAIPFNGVVQSMYNAVLNAGGYQVSSPQAGDLVFFTNGSGYGHVGIALDTDRNISGNIWYGGNPPSKVMILKNSWEGYNSWVYVRPNYKNNNPVSHDPVGHLDGADSPEAGKLHVAGWAFDRDDVNASLGIHIYVGGTFAGEISAWKGRPDVNGSFPGIGDYHGFEETIDVSQSGTQNVDVYAINVGDGGNILIGSATVTIAEKPSDTIAPTISNARAENVNENSFDIICDLWDNVGVTRVWLNIYGPGSSGGYGLEASNGTFSHTINTSDYGGAGYFTVHIYAFDAKGNETPCAVNDIKAYIDYGMAASAKGEYNGNTYEYYDYPLKWSDAYRFCEKKGGHLVTINSQGENDFLSNLLYNKIGGGWVNVLTGGKTFDHETWFWITGEPFDYMNWSADEPYMSENTNDSVNMIITSNTPYQGKWNTNNSRNVSNVVGFVCEYDNTIDASKYTPVYKQNYNGHEYWFFEDAVDWQSAKKICEAKGGHLVIIDNADENSMVLSGIQNTSKSQAWIGATDIAEEGIWRDVNRNLLTYTNWHSSQPDNWNGNEEEDYAVIWDGGTWNDCSSFGAVTSDIGFVCEFDDLCTGSGHKYTTKVVSPTTAERGYTLHTCSKCGHSYKDSYTNKLLANTSTISSTTVKAGTAVTVSAKATGGAGNYKFALSYKKSTSDKWTMVQDFSTNKSISVKLPSAGKFDVRVKVKDGNKKVVEKHFTVTVFSALSNKSTVSATKIGLGGSVTIKAKAAGGLGSYEYAVLYKLSTDTKWMTKQAFKANATLTLKPQRTGTYDVIVKVRDSRKVVVKKSFKLTVTKLTNTSKLSASKISLGSTVKITCSASGGSGFYQYAVFFKGKGDSKWSKKQGYDSNSTVYFKPQRKTAYTLRVRIKDSLGKVTDKDFTLTVS